MESEAVNTVPQGTFGWYVARWQHFTSSEVSKLIPGPRARPGELQKTALSYIYEKLAEDVTEPVDSPDPLESKEDIVWGHEHESEARAMYVDRTGIPVEECGFFLWDGSRYFGGSPDGLAGEDGIIEIKCPFRTANHVKYLLLGSPVELKELKPEYYGQIQGNLLVTGRRWCDFVSYDPRCTNPALRLKILRVGRDEDYIAAMKEAIRVATDHWLRMRADLVKILTKNG
jgi:exodeoxyribonuclease (lambda-induced)